MGPRVLLVDDDPRIRAVLRLGLADHGFQVDVAGTGLAGLAAVTAAPPDAVLLDVGLPDLDGFEVCRRIRRHSRLPVIMVSARAGNQDVAAGLDAGADEYVTKPVTAPELAARIHECCAAATGTGRPVSGRPTPRCDRRPRAPDPRVPAGPRR